MIIFGSSQVAKQVDLSGYEIYKISSAYECGYGISNLIPPLYNLSHEMILDPMQDKQFDLWYHNYIFSNDTVFIDFFSLIMHVYNGTNVYILINDSNEIYECVNESLIKLIQQRYGINSCRVAYIEDFYSINDSEDQDFSIQGIYNFDLDRKRYLELMQGRIYG